MCTGRQSMESLEMVTNHLGHSLDRISVSSAERRTRWNSKIEEIETKLGETELINSDLNQMRAELNRKIIELEKAQKPLIDENRKLQGRNRNLQQEIKKLEQQLSHTKDDFFTMKDAHERIRKENSTLKGKRTNAEKLEQLDRYRQQILEYSKCITALRSSGLAKDRRFELLVNKYKQLRAFCRSGDLETDNRSTNGSECSWDDIIISNTTHDNYEQQSHQPISCEGQSPKMLGREEENVYITRVKYLETQIDELREEIAASREHNELLEFQVLELEESTNNSRLELEQQVDSDEKSKISLEEISGKLREEKRELEKKFIEEKAKLDKAEQVTSETKEEQIFLKQMIEKMTKDNYELSLRNEELEEEMEKLREQIRPIKTELERRFEETKYKLSIALEKVHSYEEAEKEKTVESHDENDQRELEEYNSHLEIQVAAQTEIIDLLKNKLKEQNYVNGLITRFEKEGKNLTNCVHSFQEKDIKNNELIEIVP